MCQKLKILWHFEIFNTGPYGAGNFETLLCQKLKKKYDILKFFLTQAYMQLEISKCYCPTIFIAAHPNFMTKLVTMVNPNAC